MLKLIYGPKGTGKTKLIIEQANAAAEQAKGNVIFISKAKTYSVNINFDVKCVYTDEYEINGPEALRGFISGFAAANYDIEYIFVDGVARIAQESLDNLEALFTSLEKYPEINFVFTISANKDEIPEFLNKYIG